MVDYIIRPARVDDAQQIIDHRRRIANEPNNMITYSKGEFTRTLEEQRYLMEQCIHQANCHILVALVDEQIVGHCSCGGSTRSATERTVGLGIDVHPDYRGQGIGTALMQAMIEWAKDNPIVHRLELEVYTHNELGLHLYRKLGFVEEGIRREAYYKYGKYVDAVMMSMLFD